MTRGISFDQLILSIQWRHGPTWLTTPPKWPVWTQTETLLIQAEIEEEIESPTANTSNSGIHCLVDVTEFSKFTKLLAATAYVCYVCRFIYNTKHPDSRQTGPLTTSELTQANLKWIHDIQHAAFAKEIANMQSRHNHLPLVRQLRLFLDSNDWRMYSQRPSI